jgi:hypothetical protein
MTEPISEDGLCPPEDLGYYAHDREDDRAGG